MSDSTKYPVSDTPVHVLPKTSGTSSSKGGGHPAAPATIPLPQEKHYGFVPHKPIGTK